MKEHERGIIGDAYEIANSIQHDPHAVRRRQACASRRLFFAKLESLTKDRGLQASYIVDGHGKILASHQAAIPARIPSRPPPPTSPRRAHGSIVVDATPDDGTVTRADPDAGAERRLSAGGAPASIRKVFGYYQRTVDAVSANITGWTRTARKCS